MGGGKEYTAEKNGRSSWKRQWIVAFCTCQWMNEWILCWARKEFKGKKVGHSTPVYLKIPRSRNRLLIEPVAFYCIHTQYNKIRNNPTTFTKGKWITNSLLILVSCNVRAIVIPVHIYCTTVPKTKQNRPPQQLINYNQEHSQTYRP